VGTQEGSSMTFTRRRRLGAVAVAVAGLLTTPPLTLAVAIAAAAPAAAAPAAPTTGVVTVFANTDFTGPVAQTSYLSCRPSVGRRLDRAGSFDNRPLAGCQVVLRSSTNPGASLVLCGGRGTTPPPFQQSPVMQIRPGASRPCAASTS
jgi:hypothetical protein